MFKFSSSPKFHSFLPPPFSRQSFLKQQHALISIFLIPHVLPFVLHPATTPLILKKLLPPALLMASLLSRLLVPFICSCHLFSLCLVNTGISLTNPFTLCSINRRFLILPSSGICLVRLYHCFFLFHPIHVSSLDLVFGSHSTFMNTVRHLVSPEHWLATSKEKKKT